MAEWVGAGLVGLLFAVAGLLAPETWFPWVLMFAGWLMIWTGAAKLARSSGIPAAGDPFTDSGSDTC